MPERRNRTSIIPEIAPLQLQRPPQRALPPGANPNRALVERSDNGSSGNSDKPPRHKRNLKKLQSELGKYVGEHKRAVGTITTIGALAVATIGFDGADRVSGLVDGIKKDRQYSDAAITAPDCTTPLAVGTDIKDTNNILVNLSIIPSAEDRRKRAEDPNYKPTEIQGYFDGADDPDTAMLTLQQVPGMPKKPFDETGSSSATTTRIPQARVATGDNGRIVYSACKDPNKPFYKIEDGTVVINPDSISIQPRLENATVQVEMPTIELGTNPAESPFTQDSINKQNAIRTNEAALTGVARYTTLERISSQCIPQIGKYVNDGLVEHVKKQTKLKVRFGTGDIEGPSQWLRSTTDESITTPQDFKLTPESGAKPYDCSKIQEEKIK